MQEIETIASGVLFQSAFKAKERAFSDVQIGVLLLGLTEVAKNYNFGINGRIGFGRYVMSIYNADKELIVEFDEEFDSYVFSSSAEKYVELAEAHLDSVDGNLITTIEAVYGS
jgi:CRISPR type IV-associated protein Csf2